jgi:hypothetical protein
MSGFVDTYGSAIIADKIRDWIFNGQSFGTCYTQTIGGAAQGNFALSIFNPSGNNKKNILVYSAKAISNNFTAVVGLFLDAADPAYNQSPTVLNLKAGASTSSIASVTANGSTISWPSNNFDTSYSTPEMLSNNSVILLPPGNGLIIATFVGNSQEYALSAKWVEF